jgi:hypothetical protein
MSDYRLDNGVQSPTGAENFSSSLCIQTGSGAHPASYPMGTRGPLPGDEAWLGHDADHSPPTSAEVKNEQELYLLSPHAPPWRVAGSLYHFYLFYHLVNKDNEFIYNIQFRPCNFILL